jgi:DNA-binding transcriptional LysR family regulator
MDLRIKQLKVFLALAETLHFGKAAQQLYMSQPALTFQIQSMEATIGTQLFNRDRRRVELTPAGRNLVITGKRVISELRHFEDSIGRLATERPLRVICAPCGEQIVLPAVIRRLKKMSPKSNIELCSLAPIEHLRALQDNRVDALLMVKRIDTPGIAFQPIAYQHVCAVVPEGSSFAKRGSISVHEFAEQPVIVADRQHCDQSQPLIGRLLEPFGIVPRFLEAPARQSARAALVAAGMGFTMANEWRLMLAPFPGVKIVPFEEYIPPVEFGAAWRTSFESPVLASFKAALDHVISNLSKQKMQSGALSSQDSKMPAVVVPPPPALQSRQEPKYLRV